jgi:hypothetical protein
MELFTPKGLTLHCGETVHRADDPRHLGRVEAIDNTGLVKVAWQDSGWFEWIHYSDIVRLRCGDCGWKLPRVFCPHATCSAMAVLRQSRRKPKPPRVPVRRAAR